MDNPNPKPLWESGVEAVFGRFTTDKATGAVI